MRLCIGHRRYGSRPRAQLRAFHGLATHASALFTALLPRIVEADMLPARSSDVPSVPFALADDGIGIDVAELAVNAGNVGIIGSAGRGKSTILAFASAPFTRHSRPVRALDTPRGTGVRHVDGTPSQTGAVLLRIATSRIPASAVAGGRCRHTVRSVRHGPAMRTAQGRVGDHDVTVVFAVETSSTSASPSIAARE